MKRDMLKEAERYMDDESINEKDLSIDVENVLNDVKQALIKKGVDKKSFEIDPPYEATDYISTGVYFDASKFGLGQGLVSTDIQKDGTLEVEYNLMLDLDTFAEEQYEGDNLQELLDDNLKEY